MKLKVTWPKYTVKCLVCFAEKEGATKKEVVSFLTEHAESHGMNWGIRGIINDLYKPLDDLRYVATSHYMVSKDD